MISLDYLLGVIKEDEDIRANCHSLPAKIIDKHEDEENELSLDTEVDRIIGVRYDNYWYYPRET